MVRIGREEVLGLDASTICLDIIDTLPEEKMPWVAAWFKDSVDNGIFDWREFIDHLCIQFQDNQACQAAVEMIQRIEQGYNQLFQDFLKDFEYRMALCRDLFTLLGKTTQLNLSLNVRLHRALVSADLPSTSNYKEWVTKVSKVAA